MSLFYVEVQHPFLKFHDFNRCANTDMNIKQLYKSQACNTSLSSDFRFIQNISAFPTNWQIIDGYSTKLGILTITKAKNLSK